MGEPNQQFQIRETLRKYVFIKRRACIGKDCAVSVWMAMEQHVPNLKNVARFKIEGFKNFEANSNCFPGFLTSELPI